MLPADFFGKRKHSFHVCKYKQSVNDSVSTFIDRQIDAAEQKQTRRSFDDKNRQIRSQLRYSLQQPKQQANIVQKLSLKRKTISINLLNQKIKKSSNQLISFKNTARQSSFQILKNELQHIDKNIIMPHKYIHKSNSPKRQKKSQDHFKKSPYKIVKGIFNEKQLSGYMEYICGQSDKKYFVSCNFNQIRQCPKQESFKYINVNNAKLIETLLIFLLNNLESKQTQRSYLLISEFCSIYFHNYDKCKIELAIISHLLQAISTKIRPIFVYCRLLLYIIYYYAKKFILYQERYRLKIKETLTQIHYLYCKILQSVFDKERKMAIVQTFKSLKLIKQIQKRLPIIQKNINSFSQLLEIKINLKPFLTQYLYYHHLQQYLTRTQMILNWNYFQIPPVPYLPPMNSKHKFTLVISLSGTLLQYNPDNNIIKYRTYLDKFLKTAKKYYELILFSNMCKQLTDKIVQQIQNTNNLFSYRLYKNHWSYWNGKLVKNLHLLGRPLATTILIDDNKLFNSTPNNTIVVSKFKGSKDDKQLLQVLAKILKIIQSKTDDIRIFLRNQQKTLSNIEEQIEQNTITIHQ